MQVSLRFTGVSNTVNYNNNSSFKAPAHRTRRAASGVRAHVSHTCPQSYWTHLTGCTMNGDMNVSAPISSSSALSLGLVSATESQMCWYRLKNVCSVFFFPHLYWHRTAFGQKNPRVDWAMGRLYNSTWKVSPVESYKHVWTKVQTCLNSLFLFLTTQFCIALYFK